MKQQTLGSNPSIARCPCLRTYSSLRSGEKQREVCGISVVCCARVGTCGVAGEVLYLGGQRADQSQTFALEHGDLGGSAEAEFLAGAVDEVLHDSFAVALALGFGPDRFGQSELLEQSVHVKAGGGGVECERIRGQN